jgi:predicted DNA binding protein
MTANAQATPDDDICRIRAVLELTPPEECMLRRNDQDVVDLKVSVKGENPRCEWALTTDDAEIRYRDTPAGECDHCPWPIFERHGCILQILDVNKDSIVASVNVHDEEVLQQLLEELGGVCEDLKTITMVEPGRNCDPLKDEVGEVALSALTKKERKALEIAVAAGYYAMPRHAKLGDIADELDITPSAMSQRLNRAEAKIVMQLFSGD